MIRKARIYELKTLRYITLQTIEKSYSNYYEPEAMDYFRRHHRDENLIHDLNQGIVYFIEKDQIPVGTITIRENEICRFFVLLELQHQGFGTILLVLAEDTISKKWNTVKLDASIPTKEIYLRHGYYVTESFSLKKAAARNIDRYLGYDHVIKSDVDIPQASLKDRPAMGRVTMTERSSMERVRDFEAVENPMSHKEAMQEASRCLRCDHFGYGNFEGGRIKEW